MIVARYCLLAGTFRFLTEFIRVNERVALGFTVAQWSSIALVVIGAALALIHSSAHQPARPSSGNSR